MTRTQYLEAARGMSPAEAQEVIVAAALRVLADEGGRADDVDVGSTSAAQADPTPAAESPASPSEASSAGEHSAPWDDPRFEGREVGIGQHNFSLKRIAMAWVRAASAAYGVSQSAIAARGLVLALRELEAEHGPVPIQLVETYLGPRGRRSVP